MNRYKQPATVRLLGFVLVGASIFGFILSVGGLFFVWSAKSTVTNRMVDNLELALSILETTDSGLVVIGDSLGNLAEIVDTLESTLITFGVSVHDARPLVNEIRSIIGNEIPDALGATKTSLESAQASAEIVDTILRTITSIPFFPGEPYDPEVPLNIALGQVALTLGQLPDSLAETDSSLADLDENLEFTEESLSMLSTDIAQLREQLDEAELVIVSYQRILRDLTNRTENLIESVPVWINTGALILTLIFVWVFFTQIGLATQGLGYLGVMTESAETLPESPSKSGEEEVDDAEVEQ